MVTNRPPQFHLAEIVRKSLRRQRIIAIVGIACLTSNTPTLPLHGNLELNNRYSPFTTPLRLNGAVSYSNLWQLGHSVGFSFQVAPQNLNDAEVFSGYYLVRFPRLDWLSLILQGTKQNSNVSTLGGAAVAGRNQVVGAHAVIALPPGKNFFHSINFGIDWKYYNQAVNLSTGRIQSPLTYYPVSATYSATWLGKGFETDLNAGVTFNLRGMGSTEREFDNNRFKATGSFIYFRGDLSQTIDLPRGFQLFCESAGSGIRSAAGGKRAICRGRPGNGARLPRGGGTR